MNETKQSVVLVSDGTFQRCVGTAGDLAPRTIDYGPSLYHPKNSPLSQSFSFGGEDKSILYCTSLNTSGLHTAEGRARREDILQRIFDENPTCKSVTVLRSTTMSLFAQGYTTGVCVDLGHSQSSVLGVVDGFPIPESVTFLPMSGTYAGDMMVKHLPMKQSSTVSEVEYWASCRDSLFNRKLGGNPLLPDGTGICFRSQIPESYFNCFSVPGFTLTGSRLTDALSMSVARSGLHTAPLILCGGCADIRGLHDRLQEEINLRNIPLSLQNVHTGKREEGGVLCALLPFVGLSILGSMAPTTIFVSRTEFSEQGSAIVHVKCP